LGDFFPFALNGSIEFRFFLSPWRFLDRSFAAIRDPKANKTLQLTPSRTALSSADKAVFLFHQPALLAQHLIGVAELGVR